MENAEMEWAVKVVLLLAIRKQSLSFMDLSAGTKIPVAMLEHTVWNLEQAGILLATSDSKRCYALCPDAANLTMDDILNSLKFRRNEA